MTTFPTREVIRLDRVSRTYPGPPKVTAMRECNITVSRGEYITVVGPSGSGKSTFLSLVGLLDNPSSGRYLFEGIDVASLSEKARTSLRGRKIGFVFQSFHLLSALTALENVALAMLYCEVPRRARLSRAASALDRVGLTHRQDALTGHLSGGERQRVAIARALVNEPSLILCDEPTGNLDSSSAHSVLSLLDLLHKAGATIMVVTHDATVAARSERSVTIRDGMLSETFPAIHHAEHRTTNA